LKGWIDHLARKGETFQYTEAGPEGLLKGKRAIVALSSDGTKIGSEIDFASGYIRHMLGFFGITDVDFIAADQMVFGPEETLKKAEAQIDALAA
jgi:FMN-dependent NADH-azoreductase